MKNAKDLGAFYDNTPEKIAYHMPEDIRQQVLDCRNNKILILQIK